MYFKGEFNYSFAGEALEAFDVRLLSIEDRTVLESEVSSVANPMLVGRC